MIAVKGHHIASLTKRHTKHFSKLNTTLLVIWDFFDILVVSVLFDNMNTVVRVTNVQNYGFSFGSASHNEVIDVVMLLHLLHQFRDINKLVMSRLLR
jgi:hypothetical protein